MTSLHRTLIYDSVGVGAGMNRPRPTLPSSSASFSTASFLSTSTANSSTASAAMGAMAAATGQRVLSPAFTATELQTGTRNSCVRTDPSDFML